MIDVLLCHTEAKAGHTCDIARVRLPPQHSQGHQLPTKALLDHDSKTSSVTGAVTFLE
jgi:hypothetical protein